MVLPKIRERRGTLQTRRVAGLQAMWIFDVNIVVRGGHGGKGQEKDSVEKEGEKSLYKSMQIKRRGLEIQPLPYKSETSSEFGVN